VRGDGRIVGRERWQEKMYNREEWKKLQRILFFGGVKITYLMKQNPPR
jgi:hypothetical protein